MCIGLFVFLVAFVWLFWCFLNVLAWIKMDVGFMAIFFLYDVLHKMAGVGLGVRLSLDFLPGHIQGAFIAIIYRLFITLGYFHYFIVYFQVFVGFKSI